MESWSILIEFCALKPAHVSAPVQDTWFSNKKFLISCIIHRVIVISLACFTNEQCFQSADVGRHHDVFEDQYLFNQAISGSQQSNVAN